MNPKVPTIDQFMHDAFFTLTASVQAGLIEVGLCWAWSNDYLPMKHQRLSQAPLTYFLLGASLTHWRIPHFYVMHRLMHPWRVSLLLPAAAH